MWSDYGVSMPRLLENDEIIRQLSDHQNWTVSDVLSATYELDDFVAALAFVNQVGEVAEEMQHHPDIDIRWNKVTLMVSTHSEGGITQLDVELALRADQLYAA